MRGIFIPPSGLFQTGNFKLSGAGIALWLSARLVTEKVSSSNSGRNGRKSFFPRIYFLYWLYSRTRENSHPQQDNLLTPSQFINPCTNSGLKSANSIFDGPAANLLSVVCILIEVFSRAHAKGGKAFIISSSALLLVVFRATVRQVWQWKG